MISERGLKRIDATRHVAQHEKSDAQEELTWTLAPCGEDSIEGSSSVALLLWKVL